MIRLEIKNGVQTITEVCDDCKCHVNNLTLDDILVKGKTDMTIKNSKGEEVTRTKLDRPNCKCDHCED
tara:strand:+ start:101 stop:304 length:204 start_codon:yes stop_codon:yes gene_type:complete